MTVYRFRVSFEDHQEIYRDIEIKSVQTFDELHHAIQQAINFDASKNATFFQSNDYWRREKEIPLNKASKELDKRGNPILKKTFLCDYIDDPHQKLLYLFDYEKPETATWVFTVELIKLLRDENTSDYPICVKTIGSSLKQYKITKAISVSDDDDEKPKVKKPRNIVEKILATKVVEEELEDDEDGDIEDEPDEIIVAEESDIADGFGEEGEDEPSIVEGDLDEMAETDEDEFEQLDENTEAYEE